MAKTDFLQIYKILLEHYGQQNWWPAESLLEMIVGAVLTQNTNWRNVERAINNLKDQGLLTLDALITVDAESIAEQIRPAGYYNLKTKRLKSLLTEIVDSYGDLNGLEDEDLGAARTFLLNVKGVGRETADSILLYGYGKPVFIVDAYTYRIFSRHGLVAEESGYDDIQDTFLGALPRDATLFNEYHALLVRLAKDFCKKNNPHCDDCPLQGI